MDKKYQIFISSTYEDLKEERNLVIKAILEMGHIPVGMEMFSAGDEQQWQLIKKQIDDCDYYVIISAFRYGSMDAGISYSEKEYDYAVSNLIPVLGFVIEDNVTWPRLNVDTDPMILEKLNLFKTKIKNKHVSYWTDKNDLYGKVSIALMKQFHSNPRVGWVKDLQQIGPEVLSEISRLSTENAELRKSITVFELRDEDRLVIQRTIDTLKNNKRKIAFFYVGSKVCEDRNEFSFFQIFNLLAPELMIENNTKYCAYFLGMMLKPDSNKVLRKEWSTPSNTIKGIFADLNALEIVEPSLKKHTVNDNNDYWTLTEQGKVLFKEVRREILNLNLVTSTFPEDQDQDNE